MAGPGDLHSLAVEYLEAVKTALAVAPGGVIDRAYITPGPPAFDCFPQLTVHVGGPTVVETEPVSPPLAAGMRIADTGSVYMVTLTATVLRCVPTISGDGDNFAWPDPADMQAAAAETNGDLWAIWNVVRRLYRERAIFVNTNGERREFLLDPASPVPAQGGAGGWLVPIRVRLDGYGG